MAAANPPLFAEKKGDAERSDAGGSYNRTTTPTETPRPPSRETTAGDSLFMR